MRTCERRCVAAEDVGGRAGGLRNEGMCEFVVDDHRLMRRLVRVNWKLYNRLRDLRWSERARRHLAMRSTICISEVVFASKLLDALSRAI